MSKCKSCNADILWLTMHTGKKHPFNAVPKRMWVEDRLTEKMELRNCYESHFATCPDANKYRHNTLNFEDK